MSVPQPAVVSARLNLILQDSDLDHTTERMLAQKLSDYFQAPMDSHTELIQVQISGLSPECVSTGV